ncbi:hypothetical protein ACHAW6_001897 [Cyclotella cf. meneghiniana]
MDILHKCSGYKFLTELDVSMQYYTFKLDEYSQDLYTIITPFGKFKYLIIPMGLKCSSDIAQSIMETVLASIDDADVYIDDVETFSHDWDHHIKLLCTILCYLLEIGLTINPLKSEWTIKETDWLGYWLIPRGLKSRKKKIDAILHISRMSLNCAWSSALSAITGTCCQVVLTYLKP